MRNSKLIIIIMIFVVLITSCSTSEPATTDKKVKEPIGKSSESENIVSVAIRGFKFVPADLTLKVGDTIEWTNEDTAPHTVESDDGVLSSDELSKGDKYRYTFTKAGKHNYICGIHPSMKGSVTVQ